MIVIPRGVADPFIVETVHRLVAHAIRNGLLAAPECCELCGSPEYLETHHQDYAQPFAVEWLCRGCHGSAHARDNAANERTVRQLEAKIDKDILDAQEAGRCIGCSARTIRRYFDNGELPSSLGKASNGMFTRVVTRSDLEALCRKKGIHVA